MPTTAPLVYLELCLALQVDPLKNKQFVLNKTNTDTVLRHIGAVLATTFPSITQASLVGIGNFYNLSQVIRPQFPIYHELFELGKIHYRAKNFKPSMIAVGTDATTFTIDIFNRDTQGREPLVVLPFILLMPETAEASALFNEIEANLITQAHATQGLEQLLNNQLAAVENISLATLADLNSLLAAQLMHIGLEALWDIIKSALFNLGPNAQILGSGHRLLWEGDEVVFFTPTAEIYSAAYKDYDQSYEQYKQTLKRLKLVLTEHALLFREYPVTQAAFFAQPFTTATALKLIAN